MGMNMGPQYPVSAGSGLLRGDVAEQQTEVSSGMCEAQEESGLKEVFGMILGER